MVNEFKKQSGEMAVFGRKLDLTAEDFIQQNDMTGLFWQKLWSYAYMQGRFMPLTGMEALVDRIESFRTPASTDPKQLFEFIQESYELNKKAWYEHIQVSFTSTFFPTVVMHVLDDTLGALIK